MKSPKSRIADLFRSMRSRDSMTESQAMAKNFTENLSTLREAAAKMEMETLASPTIPDLDYSRFFGTGVITAAWIDDLITAPPTIKHLRKPRTKS